MNAFITPLPGAQRPDYEHVHNSWNPAGKCGVVSQIAEKRDRK